MALERFNEHLPYFQFKADFSSYCSSQCPEFENIYTLTTLNKTYKNHKKMNNTSQTCQNESGLLKVSNTEDKKIEKFIETLDHFLVKDPKFARFYLLSKIHKCIYDVSRILVILNCGYYILTFRLSFATTHSESQMVH